MQLSIAVNEFCQCSCISIKSREQWGALLVDVEGVLSRQSNASCATKQIKIMQLTPLTN